MLTGQPPERVAAPTVKVTDIYMMISWEKPFENYLEITSYQVLLKSADGSFKEFKDLCDGSDLNSLQKHFCTI